MSCSKLKKASCTADTHCTWITGKGCRGDGKQVPTKSPNVKLPIGKWEIIIPKTVKKTVMSQVHPDTYTSKAFIDDIDIIIFHTIKYIFSTVSKDEIELEDIKKTFINNEFLKLSKGFHKDGRKAVSQKSTYFWTRPFPGKINKIFGKSLTKEASLYLAGGLEYLVAEFTEVAGNLAMKEEKGTISDQHLLHAIDKRKELSKLVNIL